MKNKLLSALSVGIIAIIVVAISDLVSTLSIGSFAWIAFVLWNFTSKVPSNTSKDKQLIQILVGIPIGLTLAIGMIHIPTLFGNNIFIKYLIVFLANGIAVLFPGQYVSGIFFGIGLTFSGLGAGIMPNTLKEIFLILAITTTFSSLGMIAAWSTEKIEKTLKK